MAKGRFSKKHSGEEGNPMERGHFPWAKDMEETTELPDLTRETGSDPQGPDFPDDWETGVPRDIDPENPSAMPEVDFHNLSDEDLADLSWLDIPELSSLELEPEPDAGAQTSEASEEQAIQEAFEQVAEKKKPRRTGPSGFSTFWSARRKPVLISLAVVLAAAVLISVGAALIPNLTDPYDHRILDGVSIAGLPLGGMTRKEAESAVTLQIQPALSGTDMVLVLPEDTLTLSPRDTNVSLDVKAAVREAYDYGRTGSREEREEAYRNSLTQKHSVDLLPFLELNESYLRGQLKTYGLEHESSFTPSSYALEGERPPLDFKRFHANNTCQTLLLNLGTPGIDLSYDAIRGDILRAYAALKFQVTISPEQTGTLPEPLNLVKIMEEVSIDPVNSTLDPETFEIVSGSYGYTFNLAKARELLSKAHYGDTVRVPMEYKAPEIMDENVLFQAVLGEAETPHGSNKNRNTNLRLACETINGLILYPGDEFSFNEALGQRTADKGYMPAPAYSGNTLVDSLGGGICQVSSTLYYSCLLADLEITDRINHGFLPSYIAPGMDATVSWGRPDYKFRNSSRFPIQIRAEATDTTVRVQILGTDDRDYYVKMEYEDSITKHGTEYKEFPAGGKYKNGEVIQDGTDGHYVKTYRCKYDKQTNELISREQEAISNYPAHAAVVAQVKQPDAVKPEEPQKPEGTTPPDTTEPQQTDPVPPATEGQTPETQPDSSAGGSSPEPEAAPPQTPSPDAVPAPDSQSGSAA